MDPQLIRKGLIAAGAMNIGGVLVLSRMFSNDAINAADPVVMSNFGLLMIVVWGLAYLGAAAVPSGTRWLLGAFALEKLVYVVAWCLWISDNRLADVYAADLFAGIYYTIYGLNDFAFMLFFAAAYFMRDPAK